MNYFLLYNNHPPLIVHEQSRTEYYAALTQFDEHLQLFGLKDYFKKQLVQTWETYFSLADSAFR